MSRDLYTQRPAKGSYYPAYFRSGKSKRTRTFAWMDVDIRHNKVTITDEYGTRYYYGRGEYTAVRDAAIEHQWTLFCHLRAVPGRYPWLLEALQDESATLLAARRMLERGKSLAGIEWRRGRRRAKVVSPDSWGWSELQHGEHACTPGEFLSAVRRCCDAVGIGDYDTPAALGTEALQKAWQEQHLGRLWILPRDIRGWFHASPSAPRIWESDTGVTYSRLVEFDLRAAYATALAGCLALNQPCYVSAREAASDLARGTTLRPDTPQSPHGQAGEGIYYGLWRCEAETAVLYGPVRALWGEKEPGYHIQPGVYELPLWGEQAAALTECGCRLTWLKGYCWQETGTPFAGYVEQMKQLRKQAEDEGDTLRAGMLKRLPNAAVGRFNCFQSCTVVPASQAVEDDALFSLGASDGNLFDHPETLAAVHTSPASTCVPEHWYQYIVSQVSLQIWQAERRAVENGHRVISANIDSYRIIQPSLALDHVDTGTWKTIYIKDATVRASRHIDAWMSCNHGATWQRMIRAPGVRRE